tara:strand:- start:324 stop:572 length:249 start_codon:yes stop_codon:yes gene_type:complete
MKIKYFSWLKDITKLESEEITIKEIVDSNSLKKYLCQKYPKLEEYIFKDEIIRIAVNLEYITENTIISNQDEIALFPPVSGG